MIQKFIIRQMLKSQGVPEAQIEMLVNMIEKNPELFKKIAAETKEKMNSGLSQNDAAKQVMKKYEQDLKNIAV